MSRMRRALVAVGVSLASLTCGGGAAPVTKIRSLDFERSASPSWAIFIPAESEEAGCVAEQDQSVAHSGGAAVRLSSTSPARYGLRFLGGGFAVKPGDRLRLSAWVRLDSSFEAEANTPGVLLRWTLFDDDGQDIAGGHRYVGLDGQEWRTPGQVTGWSSDVDDWTALHAEIVIPPGVATVEPMIFVWKGRGTLWLDDVRCERLAGE